MVHLGLTAMLGGVSYARLLREEKNVATHPQAAKRNRQRIRIQAHHRHYRTAMRTTIKRLRAAIEAKDVDQAKAALGEAVPMIDRGAQKNVLPRKRASRFIARLTAAVNGLSNAPVPE